MPVPNPKVEGFRKMSTPDRFFYHSFPRPRRKGGDGQLKGLKILEAIVDFGLVLSPAFAARLIEIDEDFWSQTFPTPAAGFTNVSLDLRAGLGNRVVDWAYGFQGIDERHIIGAARRVIVPCAALELAERIIAKHPTPPSVVAIEDLAG